MASTELGMPTVGPLQSAAPYPLRLVLNWGRRYSLWVFNFGLACCAIEFIAASTSRHDFIRLGVIPFAHGPRQADLMIVSGTVTDKMAPAVRRLYQQMADPKYVISFGACSNSGGPYWDSYCVTKGVDQIIPVDVYVPGCPPRPEALLQSIVKLQEKIAGENLARRYKRRERGSHALSAGEATRPLVRAGGDGTSRASRGAGQAAAAPGGVASLLQSMQPPATPAPAVTLRPHVPVAGGTQAPATQPVATQPVATQPVATPPAATTQPLPAPPAATQPLPTQPVPAEPRAEDTADLASPLVPADEPAAQPTARIRIQAPEEGRGE